MSNPTKHLPWEEGEYLLEFETIEDGEVYPYWVDVTDIVDSVILGMKE